MRASLQKRLGAALAEAKALRVRLLKMRHGMLELIKDDLVAMEARKPRRKTCPARSRTAGKCARAFGHDGMHCNAKQEGLGGFVS